jgi:hypothetical protein
LGYIFGYFFEDSSGHPVPDRVLHLIDINCKSSIIRDYFLDVNSYESKLTKLKVGRHFGWGFAGHWATFVAKAFGHPDYRQRFD